MAQGHPTKAALAAKKKAYLTMLAAGNSFMVAMHEAKMNRPMIATARKRDKAFRDEEAQYLGKRPHETMKADYLHFLRVHCGNHIGARLAAQIPKALFEAFRKDEEFIVAEAEVYERLVADAEEQSMKIALGRGTKTKDSGHLRWKLGKLVPDKWGEKPRVVEHHHISDEALDVELERLLGIEAPHEPDSRGD